MKAYLDNVAASGHVRGDLAPSSEMKALRYLETAASTGKLELVTSRESWSGGPQTKPHTSASS